MAANTSPNDILKIKKLVGAKIRFLREAKGIKNYEKFAIQNGFSRSHYWNIEQGKVNLTLKSLVRILNSLEVDIADFFRDLNK